MLYLQAAAVFYAFAFEAYLNHVGSEVIEIWEEIERIPHGKKLRIIAKHLKLQLDHCNRHQITLSLSTGFPKHALIH